MEITCLGNNTLTVCPNCDEILAVKGHYDLDELDELFDKHLSENLECQKFQDSLPSLDELFAAVKES